jgi:hypothetical protein
MQDTFTPAVFRFKAMVLFEGAADSEIRSGIYMQTEVKQGAIEVLAWTSEGLKSSIWILRRTHSSVVDIAVGRSRAASSWTLTLYA